METAAISEILPIKSLGIRPITVVSNTLNALRAVYNLEHSPLVNLILNPLSGQSPCTPENIVYKGYDLTLDKTQLKILNTIYKRCINLNVPNISLLDGAAGTGKSCMIVNLALQLVYGDDLPKPLKILICSKSNGSIDEITSKLIDIRDRTCEANKKMRLVRFGFLSQVDSAVAQVSVQHLKELKDYSPQFASYKKLTEQKTTLDLKLRVLTLDDSLDNTANISVLKKQLFKVNALLERFEGLEKKKLQDTTTFILNSCDIICTTLGSISKLQNYVPKVDVCIIDEATQCNEPFTLLPFRFGMPSVVLVGDSQLLPVATYSRDVKERNYGHSLFARFQKLFLGKLGSPVFEMHFQYRIHEEILIWPNYQFYKSRLVPHETVKDNSFPIVPYKVISYGLDKRMETEKIMLVIKVLLGHVDWNKFTIGVICTNFKQNFIMKNKLKDHPYITTNTAESYLAEKDVIIIWVSKEYGMCHLGQQQILNTAVTRAKKCLLICGADLTSYKNRPIWRALLENAQNRKCIQHFKTLTALKVCNTLQKESNVVARRTCVICKF